MPYNQQLDQRIRAILAGRPGLEDKKMFGGVGYMVNGNLACGVQGESLIVRVGVDNNASALAKPFVRPFMPTGNKPMAGWVLVDPPGWENEAHLLAWVEQGYVFAQSLPPKE